MLSKKDFTNWFRKEVEIRWKKHTFGWTEMGDWHWRLQDFDLETLTQAVRRHKACEDYRTPSLKKVYEYAGKIKASNSPKRKRSNDDNAGVPDDEDGVVFPMSFVPGTLVDIDVTLNADGNLAVWIDWFGDGDWAETEDAAYNGFLSAGTHTISVDCPSQGRIGHTTYARFRFSTGAISDYRGALPDGEVEDHDDSPTKRSAVANFL